MKVLIVDDNVEITTMLTDFLSLSGINVTICNDGKQGLSKILEGGYDKVLLDLAMPEFSGVDVIENLKEQNYQHFSKIIIFTASSVTDAEIKNLLSTGIKTCVKKPVKMPELVQTLTT